MATILLTWELGGGWGHLYPLKLLGSELTQRGHSVLAALRETTHATLFQECGIPVLLAPAKQRPSANRINPPGSYAHVLHNIGFGDEGELGGMLYGWQSIFKLVKPDLVIVDHSPTALLALRGTGIPTALYGMGFYCPPDRSPLVSVRPWEPQNEVLLARDEEHLLQQINLRLAKEGRPQLQYLARLFHEVNENLLVTFAEIDHFGPRSEASYWGSLPSGVGAVPKWPDGQGPRIYAYLKNFPGLEHCLGLLRNRGFPTLAICSELSEAACHQMSGGSLQIQREGVDLGRVSRECDLAINNASHGVTAALLLAGRPLLQLPIFVEQFLIADRVARLGAGIFLPPGDFQAFEQGLQTLVTRPEFRFASERFAEQYRHHDPNTLIGRIADRLETLVS